MSISPNALWMISPSVRSTYSEDGAVLLDIDKGVCYSLNAVGGRVWVAIEASQAGMTLDAIVSALETHFQVPRHELVNDTAEYLDKLQRMGLVHSGGEGVLSKVAPEGS